jgi:hypothetical protein
VNARAERWQRRFEVPILVAALLVIPVIAVEESSLGRPWTTIAAAVNLGNLARILGRGRRDARRRS